MIDPPALRLVQLDGHGRPRLSLDGSGRLPAPAQAAAPAAEIATTGGPASDWDVVVIGGGPAGSAFARGFAAAGGRVLLLERAAFPREHGGESLLPGIWPLLDELQVSARVADAGFVPKAGGTFVVAGGRDRWDVPLGSDTAPSSRQVRRADFDQILLEHAAASGAEVRCGWRAAEVLFDGPRAVGVRAMDANGGEHRFFARWTVDASGDTALLGCRLGVVQFHPILRNRVLWSYWKHSECLPARSAGNTMGIQRPDGWLWHVPLGGPDALAVAGIVAAESSSLWSDPDPAGRYHAIIAESELGRELLRDAIPVGEVQSRPAVAYCCSRLSGEGWLLAGDSACFVDPLLTSGVQLACQHGLLAARAVGTALADPALAADALAYYERSYRRRYEDHVRLCLNMYGLARARPDSQGPPPTVPPSSGPQGAAMAARLGFVSLISGLSAPEIVTSMTQYATLLARPPEATGTAMAGPAGPPGGDSGEVLDFLLHGLQRRRLAVGRAERIRDELGADVTIRAALGVCHRRVPFLAAPGAPTFQFATAVENRFGDRYAATPELEAILAHVQEGRAYRDVERRVRETPGNADLDAGTIGRWLELLADQCLIEWQRCVG